MATRDQLNGDIVRNQLVEITITCTQKKQTNKQSQLSAVVTRVTRLYRGDGGGEHWLVRMEWRPAGRLVSASVNLPLHQKVQKFSSGTSSPRWSPKKAIIWW